MKVKEIEVGLGVSIDTGSSWVKPNAKITIECDKGMEELERAWARAWREVQSQVSNQISMLG